MEKILFYTSKNFIFRSGIIGYLYEISQIYPVILLSEELDRETDELIRDKKLFPKLKEIISTRQYSGEKTNLFSKNRYLYNLAKNVLFKYQPDVLMITSDTHSLFELYLMRFAKKTKAIKIAVQNSNVGNNDIVKKYIDLENAYTRFPLFLPLWFRIFLMNCRKYIGHFLYYWLLPLTVGEMPFLGKVGHILWMGCSGRREADYQTVFSKMDYKIHLKDRVPVRKLCIVSHPLLGGANDFFRKILYKETKKYKNKRKIVTFILPVEQIGFKRLGGFLISKEEVQKTRREIVILTAKILPDWKIFLKPHPDIRDLAETKKNFQSLSNLIKITKPSEPVDRYLEISDVIIGLPPASTALFTARLRYPAKPIISVDLYLEMQGDAYKEFDGIEYVDSKEKLINVLSLIRDNKYFKKVGKTQAEGFLSIIDFLRFITNNKKKEI